MNPFRRLRAQCQTELHIHSRYQIPDFTVLLLALGTIWMDTLPLSIFARHLQVQDLLQNLRRLTVSTLLGRLGLRRSYEKGQRL